MERHIVFTTSWDDGHPLDMRLAEVLSRHDFKGTFYLPLSNREGLPVMPINDMRRLAETFEVGSHTIDHCYLDSVDPEARRQIACGKDRIEQILGRRVPGFCYPGGHYSRKHRQMVIEAGFEYARTITSFHGESLVNPFVMPTTLQFYPHKRYSLVRNFIRQGAWQRRSKLFAVALSCGDMTSRLHQMLDHVCRDGGVFHLWGHSWELEKFDGWRQLESFLLYAADRIPAEKRLTNRERLHHATAHSPHQAARGAE